MARGACRTGEVRRCSLYWTVCVCDAAVTLAGLIGRVDRRRSRAAGGGATDSQYGTQRHVDRPRAGSAVRGGCRGPGSCSSGSSRERARTPHRLFSLKPRSVDKWRPEYGAWYRPGAGGAGAARAGGPRASGTQFTQTRLIATGSLQLHRLNSRALNAADSSRCWEHCYVLPYTVYSKRRPVASVVVIHDAVGFHQIDVPARPVLLGIVAVVVLSDLLTLLDVTDRIRARLRVTGPHRAIGLQ